MSNLSVLEMMDQLAPGETRVFPPTLGGVSGPERYMVVSRNYNRDASPQATDLEWIDPTSMPKYPTTGGVKGNRVSLSEVPTIRAKFTGNPDHILDYYGLGSELFIVSEKLKNLINEIDPDSVEFAPILIEPGANIFSPFYAALPARVLWAVDTNLTEVTVISREFLPGKFNYRVHYAPEVFLKDSIPEDVHFFKDFGSPAFFWSNGLVKNAVEAGITGMQAESPSNGAKVKAVYL